MKGVYCILNTITNKQYIGSTSESFKIRFIHHKWSLKNNKHKNSHLQHAWNKYGEDVFIFKVIEEVEDMILEREQYWIDQQDFESLYNINPFATGGTQFSEETIKKRTQSITDKWASGDLDHYKELNRTRIKDRSTEFKIGSEPWNKGRTYESTEHLKVPKKNKGSREVFKENMRNSLPGIEVYDMNNNLLGSWRSTKDLQEWSLTIDNNLPINSRFKTSRKGKPVNYLASNHINQAATHGSSYKGLLFKFKLCPSVE